MKAVLERRSVLSLLAALPLVAGSGRDVLAAPPTPRLRRVAATPSREVEVTSWAAAGPRIGTIAFSPGFGSSPRFYPDFAAAWTAAGYDVLAPLHVDSREHPNARAFTGSAIWAARIADMRAVASLIEGPYFAAGHSFGALGALVLAGAAAVVPPGITRPLADERVIAALAFSPPPPAPTLITQEGYAALSRPALIQTGTRDVLPAAVPDPQSWRGHLAAFARAPMTGDHHGLVLEGADHYFGGLICDPAKQGPDQRAALRLAIAASLAVLAQYRTRRGGAKPAARPSFPIDPAARFYLR